MDARILKGGTEDEVMRQIDRLESPDAKTAPPPPPTLSDHSQAKAATAPKARKVNMGAGVLLRWGK